MVLVHDYLRPVLSFVVHDADHVLADLDLAFVRSEVHIDGVVVADGMRVEYLHFAR